MKNSSSAPQDREPELAEATGYVVHIHKSVRPVGFVTPTKGKKSKDLLDELVERFKEMAKEYPDILLETVRGEFEDSGP